MQKYKKNIPISDCQSWKRDWSPQIRRGLLIQQLLQAGKREQDKSHADLLAIKDQELSSLREDLEGAIEEKDTEIAALVRDHQERIVAHSGELEELSTAHRQELSDCKAQLEEETGELYDQLSDLQAKVDALTAESCDLNTQLAEVLPHFTSAT